MNHTEVSVNEGIPSVAPWYTRSHRNLKATQNSPPMTATNAKQSDGNVATKPKHDSSSLIRLHFPWGS